MLISSLDLINLPVYSESGQYLGKISAFDINIETHQVSNYYVKTGIIKGLWHQQLIIAPKQVISIAKEKMVVSGNVSRPVGKVEMATPMAK